MPPHNDPSRAPAPLGSRLPTFASIDREWKKPLQPKESRPSREGKRATGTRGPDSPSKKSREGAKLHPTRGKSADDGEDTHLALKQPPKPPPSHKNRPPSLSTSQVLPKASLTATGAGDINYESPKAAAAALASASDESESWEDEGEDDEDPTPDSTVDDGDAEPQTETRPQTHLQRRGSRVMRAESKFPPPKLRMPRKEPPQQRSSGGSPLTPGKRPRIPSMPRMYTPEQAETFHQMLERHLYGYWNPRTSSPAPQVRRTCMKCWLVPCSIFCKECTVFLCGPCFAKTHAGDEEEDKGNAAKQRHTPLTCTLADRVIRHGLSDGDDEEGREDGGGELGDRDVMLGGLKRRVTGLSKHTGEGEEELQLETLPDPAFGLPIDTARRIKSTASRSPVGPGCKYHGRTEIDYACVTCDYLPTCTFCFMADADHFQHERLSLEDAAAQVRQILANDYKEMSIRSAALLRAAEDVKLLRQSVVATVDATLLKISEEYGNVFGFLKQKYGAVVKQLSLLQDMVCKDVRLTFDEAMRFKSYLELKAGQIRHLKALGRRNAAAGLNAWTKIRSTYVPLLKGAEHPLVGTSTRLCGKKEAGEVGREGGRDRRAERGTGDGQAGRGREGRMEGASELAT
eukprot:GHVU01171459.1.p1 GENE.GHVU01171459.1~~GHVU01171459.1.p1  ORF type:complete len:629 (-),score=83.83 GHVU01171459.1:2183-4069(-)